MIRFWVKVINLYDNVRKSIMDAVKYDTPDAVLFSGGVDSTAILYESFNINKDVVGITVGVKGSESSDIYYSKMVATELGVKHYIYYVEKKDILKTVETSIKIMKTFNPEWISSTTTLLLGMKCAKKLGLKSISSGEGADDLLGSFPFFRNFEGSNEELNFLLEKRLDEIDLMTDMISKYIGIRSIAPYKNEIVKNTLLSIPIEERILQTDDIKTKYPLRKAYEKLLPNASICRPQTMAFSGSGVYDVIKSIGDNISDDEFLNACNNYFPFKNKLEYGLFRIYVKFFIFEQSNDNNCIHCQSPMEHDKVCCKVCATFQYKGKEMKFNG